MKCAPSSNSSPGFEESKMFEPYDAKVSRTVPMGGKCMSTYLSKPQDSAKW